MTASFVEHLQAALEVRKTQDLQRTPRVRTGHVAPIQQVGLQNYLSFNSNDYLGLASHAGMIASLQQEAELSGVGSGSAHLVGGHCVAHQALEQALAVWLQRERALLFSTGYMANIGVLCALVKPDDQVFCDRLVHASLLDGIRLSGATMVRYRHNDLTHLSQCLARSAGKGRYWIVTEGVFSMDGDIAPLNGIVALAKQYQAQVYLDDAHGLGVIGHAGQGSLSYFQLSQEDKDSIILMGTLGKAFGAFGAFVAGQAAIIETCMQLARSYVYTTALPPAMARAAMTSLQILQQETWRVSHLQALINQFCKGARKRGLPVLASKTAIQPVMVGSATRCLTIAKALAEQGFWVAAIRPPTVPMHTARLRITLTAQHTHDQVSHLLDHLAICFKRFPAK